jgi:DNA-directed RNA polymerase specialized sigma subunit
MNRGNNAQKIFIDDKGPEDLNKGKEIDRSAIVERKAETKVLRQMVMELCCSYSTLNQIEMGEIFGVDCSTVSQNRARLKTRLRKDKRLRKAFAEMEGEIILLSK